jgi:hypothetical protein
MEFHEYSVLGPCPPTRHNPGRQINSHNPGRRERGAEHPTSHTDIKSKHVSQINISCRQLEHVKSCGGRRHLASHPNAVASYPYKSRPFAYPERRALVLQQKWAKFHTQTQFSQNSQHPPGQPSEDLPWSIALHLRHPPNQS